MPKFTIDDLLIIHKELCDDSRAILKAKNHDYSGSGNSCFANFEASEVVAGVSREKGILVRLADKISRLRMYLEQGEFHVENEGFNDTIKDSINYLILLAGMQLETGSHAAKPIE